jgi:glycosyltransferase involved in cell wall biosynthesis
MQIRGGAGLSALKLHEALLREDQVSKLYVAHHTIFKDRAIKIPTQAKYKQNWWNLGTIPVDKAHSNIVASGYAGTLSSYIDDVLKDADVTVLRWVTATISDFQIAKIGKSGKPLLWVLSDMAPFTGGCHYSNDCNGYQTYCFPCPLLSEPRDLSCQLTVLRRKRLWENIHVIAPSEWIYDKAKESTVFRDMPIHLVRTGVELDIFYPIEVCELRKELGLNKGDVVILFGADSANDPRKGFTHVEPTLSILKQHLPPGCNIVALIFGSNSHDVCIPGCRVVSMGPISPEDKNKLRSLYSVSDVTLLPYVEDNMPNVMLESIACGTPVVSFAVCGMKEVICDSVNGWLAHPFDPRSLAFSIIRCLNSGMTRQSIREWAEINLDVKSQALSFIKIASTAFNSLPHRNGGLQ